MRIFVLMKNAKFQTIFLVFLIVSPLLVSSFKILEISEEGYELYESAEDKEQSEEKEVEDVENIGKYLLSNHEILSFLYLQRKKLFLAENSFFAIYPIVLTPPPEFVLDCLS